MIDVRFILRVVNELLSDQTMNVSDLHRFMIVQYDLKTASVVEWSQDCSSGSVPHSSDIGHLITYKTPKPPPQKILILIS